MPPTEMPQRCRGLAVRGPLLVSALLLPVACTIPPDRGVTLTYKVVGQCDTMNSSFDENNQPIADFPGAAYLVIQIYRIENNRPQALAFQLTDAKLYVNEPSRPAFDQDKLVHSPSPQTIPAGADYQNTFLPYVALIPGFANELHPSQDAAQVNWHVLYHTAGLPDGQAVVLIKSPEGAGGQVQPNCFNLRIGP